MPKRVLYTIRCPRGDECKKGGRRLKRSTDKNVVQEALYIHLSRSSYHTNLSKEDCAELVRAAEVESWEDERSEGEGSRGRPLTQCVRSDCDIRFKHPLFVFPETQPV